MAAPATLRNDHPEQTTLLELIQAINEVARTDREVVATRVQELGYELVDREETLAPPAAEPLSFLSFLWQRRDTRLALYGALLILPGLLFNELLPMLSQENPLLDLTSVAAMLVAGLLLASSATNTPCTLPKEGWS